MGMLGSGKSTLMNIIGCLAPPSSGNYYHEDRELTTYNDDELALARSDRPSMRKLSSAQSFYG
jgi:ABC-type lipoprotein export system ATPase subunit